MNRYLNIFFTLLLLTGCQLEEMWEDVKDEHKGTFTIEEARDFFEDDYSEKITKTTGDNRGGKLATGDFTTLWDKAERVINGRHAAYYIDRSCIYTVVTEDLTPIDLPAGTHIFSFSTDNIGFAATQNYRENRFTISRTFDKGRHWEYISEGKGRCTEIKAYGKHIWYVVLEQDNDGNKVSHIQHMKDDESTICIETKEGEIYCLNIFDDRTLSFAVHDWKRDLDSLFISNDSGKSWAAIGKDLEITNVFGHDSTRIYMNAQVNDTIRFHIIDINTQERRSFSWVPFNIETSNDLIMSGSKFYRYNGKEIKHVSGYNWNSLFNGSYNAVFLTGSNKLAFGYATQFPGVKDREECMMYSTNGSDWTPIRIGKGLVRKDTRYSQPSISHIPHADGLSVIYQDYSDTLHIVNIIKQE